jgi:flagellar protein FlbB
MKKNLLLLFLIAAVASGGLVWFDYLNVIDIKTVLAPIYNKLGLNGRSQPEVEKGEVVNLDAERLAVRLEMIELRNLEILKKEEEFTKKQSEIEQIAAALEEDRTALEDMMKSTTENASIEEVRNRHIEENARNLNNMPPQSAVAIITAMDDQMAIDVIRKTEELAKATGGASIVPFWYTLMPPARAAELQRKIAERPN